MADLLKKLPNLTWRGIAVPITGRRDYGFDQDTERHKFIFRDHELIESLGRSNPTWIYTVPFREDIAKAPWSNLFTQVYPEFLVACQDRSAGILRDPIHGEVRAKCMSLRESLDVLRRDGVDVTVEFVLAPEAEQTQTDASGLKSLQGAAGAASRFDQQVAKVDWEQEQPPEPTVNIFDAVTSIGNQLEASKNKIEANMEDLAFRMEKTKNTIDRVKNPNLAPLRQAASRLQWAAIRLADEASTPPTPTEILETSSAVTVIGLSAAYNMAVADFLRLNPALSRVTIVPSGTKIRINKRNPNARS